MFCLNDKKRLEKSSRFFLCTKFERRAEKKKAKTLQEVKTEIKNLEEEKESYENQLQQLRNREKILIKQAKIKEQKKRNHRLIIRGVILESFIEGAEEKSEEEIKAILGIVFAKYRDDKDKEI